jgi:CRP-like cAMP-binding protein
MTLSDVEVIRKLDFFEPLDNKIIKKIALQCFTREFGTGEVIIRQGEPGLGLYFISSGRVRVEIENSGIRTLIAELGVGDCVGELSIVDDKARSASVVCAEPTKCLLLTRDSFSKMMNKHPQIAIQMVKALATRLRATNVRILQPGRQQPAQPLVDQAQPVRPQRRLAAVATGGSASPLLLPAQMVDSYTSAKGKLRDLFVDVFSSLCAARAMTRFSMAVIGCPVTVYAEDSGTSFVAAAVDDVKICLFPAADHLKLRINAYGDGNVSVTVLRPEPGAASHLRATIRRNDKWRLHVPPSSSIWMEVASDEAVRTDHSR